MRPIERADDVDAFVEAARDGGPVLYAFVLCLLDAALRLGEVRALRFTRIMWGVGDDPRRHLVVDSNLPTDGDEGLPKSGRGRRVALSRRLRDALFVLYR